MRLHKVLSRDKKEFAKMTNLRQLTATYCTAPTSSGGRFIILRLQGILVCKYYEIAQFV